MDLGHFEARWMSEAPCRPPLATPSSFCREAELIGLVGLDQMGEVFPIYKLDLMPFSLCPSH